MSVNFLPGSCIAVRELIWSNSNDFAVFRVQIGGVKVSAAAEERELAREIGSARPERSGVVAEGMEVGIVEDV